MVYPTAKCLKLVAIVMIAIGLSACSEQKTTQEYISSSVVYVKNLEYGAAIVEMKNAARQAPKNAEVRYYLAKAYIEQGSYVNAEKELDKAEKFGFDMTMLLPELVFIKSKLNKVEEVFALVEDTASLSDEQYMVVLTYAGITALNNKELERAQDFIAQANAISETSLHSQMGKAYLFYKEGNSAKGIALVNTVLGASPDFSEALLLKGHLLFTLKDYIAASNIFSQYLIKHPMAHHVRLSLVDSLIKALLFDQAEDKVNQLLLLVKASAQAHHYKGLIALERKNFKEAKKQADLAIRYSTKEQAIPSKLIAGISAFKLGNYEQTYTYLKPLEQYFSSDHFVFKMLSVTKLKLGYLSEAADDLNDINNFTKNDIEFIQASSYELYSAGDIENATILINKAQKLDPENAQLLVIKGKLLLSSNDKEGIRSLERAINIDPDLIDVELLLAMEYLRSDRVDEAKKIANAWLKSEKNKINGYLLQGVIFTKENKINEAKINFEKIKGIQPKNVAATYNLALLEMQQGNLNKATGYFMTTIELAPTHIEALLKLTKLSVKHNKVSDTVQFLSGVLENNPQNLSLKIALAQNLLNNNKVEQATSLLNTIERSNKLPSAYWILLGDSYLKLKKIERAIETFQQALNFSPDNYLFHLRLISSLDLNKNFIKALDASQSAYLKYKNNTSLEVFLAYFYLRNNKINECKKYLAILAEKTIKHPLIYFTSGQLALSEGNYELAINNFSQLFSIQPTQINIIKLARALKFGGKQIEAEKILETYLKKNPSHNYVRSLLTELYPAKEHQKIAVQYQILKQNIPNNSLILNNLAWHQYKQGLIKEALGNSSKAYQLNKIDPSISETYAVILVANKQFKQGLTILQQANNDTSSNDAKLSLAMAFIAEEQFDNARKILTTIDSKDQQVVKRLHMLREKLN